MTYNRNGMTVVIESYLLISLENAFVSFSEECGNISNCQLLYRQMKTLLDRLNPLYSSDYAFRDIYMIATAAEDEDSAFEKAYNGLLGWVDCFEKAELKGIVTGGGIADPNDAGNHKDTMQKAYELGKGL